jgi:hypothetical protein
MVLQTSLRVTGTRRTGGWRRRQALELLDMAPCRESSPDTLVSVFSAARIGAVKDARRLFVGMTRETSAVGALCVFEKMVEAGKKPNSVTECYLVPKDGCLFS